MKIYARVESGTVTEIVKIDETEPELEQRYHAAVLDHFIELQGTPAFTVKIGWKYDGQNFYQTPTPEIRQAKRYVKVSVFRERMEETEHWDALVAILQSDMSTLLRILTLDVGIDPDDQQIRDLIAAAGANPDVILAP